MWGGCPARAPPDENQIEMEVTWEDGKVHQDTVTSEEALLSDWRRWGSAHLYPDFSHHHQPSQPPCALFPCPLESHSTLASLAPVPGFLCHGQRAGITLSWGGSSLYRFPLRATCWHKCCHGSDIICKGFLVFRSVLLCRSALVDTGSFKSWRCRFCFFVFLFHGLCLQFSSFCINFVWEEGTGLQVYIPCFNLLRLDTALQNSL